MDEYRKKWLKLIIKKCGRNCKYVKIFLKEN